jgi:TolB-like protein/DNA-binding winged helix-turn-helix (wHTH) protein
MPAQIAKRFEFSGFVLDAWARTLSGPAGDVPLRPKSFDVLAYLVRHAGSVVEKDEIIAAVWPNVIASDDSLARCISDVRAALGDEGRRIVRTAPGRGYRFAAEVAEMGGAQGRGILRRRWAAPALAGALALAAAIAGAVWLGPADDGPETPPIRRSIAVLPFWNSSGTPETEPLVAGLTADLNAALARIPELLVISETSTRRYAGEAVDVRRAAADLDVEHVLTGTVQSSGDRIRVSAQLSSGRDGSAVWSERYDRDRTDFLKLQDDIVRNVLVGLQIELTHGETARAIGGGTNDLDAWLLNTQGLAKGFEFKRESNRIARELFAEAARRDPDWAPPVSGLAWTYREALRRGWSDDAEADRAKWLRLAERCRELDPDFYGCYIQLGNYHIENGRIEEGVALRETALRLAPNELSALSGLGWQLLLLGRVERGLALLGRAKLVSPIHPPWLIATEAYGLQLAGRYDEAIAAYRYALEHIDFPDLHGRLATVYVEAGDLEMAREEARLYREQRPDGRISDLTRIFKIQDPERTRRYAELLRKAGIPD